MTSTPITADPLARQLAAIERLISEGKLQEAGRQIEAVSTVARGDARIYLLICRLAEASGDLVGSIEGARLAVKAAPGWSVAMTEFALALARANQFKDSLGAAERAVQMDPNNPAVLTRVIDVAHRAQHFEVALAWLRRLWALAPGNRAVEQMIARDLRLLKRYPEALQAYNALIEADGPQAATLLGRLQTALEAGETQVAQADAASLLALEPGNTEYQFWAARARGETPDQQPAQMVQAMYDGFAPVFDDHLVLGLKYKLPKLVGERILQWYPDRKFNLLDLGCGTGLLGVCLGRIDGWLIGVDLSQAMIDQAARHGVYDRFHRVDLLEALEATPESLYDVLAALDVFIYTGELARPIANAHRILKPGGRLVFSCESAGPDEADFVLRPSMRYAHKASSIEALCRAAGFEAIDLEPMPIRHEQQQAIDGFLVTARKAA